VRFGHPLAVGDDWAAGDPLPELDFGPLISATKAGELRRKVDEAVRGGAVPLYRGRLDGAPFLDGQDTSAYVAPSALLAPPGRSRLMHAEPFGPVDTIVVVDTPDELLAAMNASNGALVASLACDDEEKAAKLAVDCRRSRSASTSRARAATATSRSAVAAPRGRARSSAATCWCRP
jgi:acyl-CoA reductase-like NAD-dependent aldehyde dehydrogenase